MLTFNFSQNIFHLIKIPTFNVNSVIQKMVLVIFYFICFVGLIIFVALTVESIKENEKRAVKRSVLMVFILLVLGVIVFFLPQLLQVLFAFLSLVLLFLILLPFGNKSIKIHDFPEQYDERKTMFSREELTTDSVNYKLFYQENPDLKKADDLFRKNPGVLNADSLFFQELLFNAASVSFQAVKLLHPFVEGKEEEKLKTTVPEDSIAEFIKNWAIKLGAHSVGFTELKTHHKYSVGGRQERRNRKIELNHKFALAFTPEMEHDFVQLAPQGPIILESSQQYFNAGQIAIQLAQFIRNLGFDARAHIDANYQVICPIVAQDAGLGTIGRMGLLMTPTLGSRVRIGVVSTNLNLQSEKKQPDSSMIQFCEMCKKCVSNCPSNAISGSSQFHDKNWKRGQINQEACFTYWTKIGTDCGRCIAVCPFSHPPARVHNIVRWMIKRNQFNRWLALKFDDFLYSRHPKSKPLKSWMKAEK